MSRAQVSMQQVIDGLSAEGLLSEDACARGRALMHRFGELQPWYVRAMVGFGAWISSLLLVGFVAGLSASAGSGFLIFGAVFIGGAVVLRRLSGNDFSVQMALAISLAGQGLMAMGLVDLVEWKDPDAVLAAVCLMSLVLFLIFPDRLHRILMVVLALGSFVALLYFQNLGSVVPFVGPACAAACVVLSKRAAAWYASGRGEFVRPLQTGLMLSAFVCLLLSAVYILPELADALDLQVYPRPWISTLLLGALLLYTGADLWRRLGSGGGQLGTPLVYGLVLVVIAASWWAPGLLLALVVIVLGASTGNSVVTWAGISFLILFLSAFFYAIETSMLVKSMTLVATGCAVLLARHGLLKLPAATGETGAENG